MRSYTLMVAVAALAAGSLATGASATVTHLTDVQYLQASRCEALFASPALGKQDTSQIDALLKREQIGRLEPIYSRADEMRRDAARLARDANGARKASLMAERDGVCEAYNGGDAATAARATVPTSN